MTLLRTEQISVSFGQQKILENISIRLQQGEIVSLLGVSGAGKTTLFNVVSGLLIPDSGKVYLKDRDVTGKAGQVSYMLQKDLLLPYKTVIDNVSMPLRIRGMKKREARARVQPYFQEFGLEGTEKKYPGQLSGGMKQRAALLRTYLFSDEVALLDEPFSALDTITKSAMHKWYLDIMEQIKLSTLLITHDIDEALLLSDRIYILGLPKGASPGDGGQITQEIRLDNKSERSPEFLLTDQFLTYKRRIIEAIGGIS